MRPAANPPRPALLPVLATLLAAVLFMAWAAAATPAPAANPSPAPLPAPSADALAVAGLLGLEGQLIPVSRQAITPLVEQVMSADPQFTPADREAMAAAWAQVILRQNRAAYLDRLAGELDQRFTPEELARMRRFYASPAGRKLTALIPELAGRGRELGLELVTAWLDRINADPKQRAAFFAEVNQLLDPELRRKCQGPKEKQP